jgi:hypothetical protein
MKALLHALIVLAICSALPIQALNLSNRTPAVLVLEHRWYKDEQASGSMFIFKGVNEGCSERSINPYFLPSPERESEASAQPCLVLSIAPQKTAANSYVYRVKIRNDGSQIIRAIEWDYVFIDPETNAELARHRFYSESKCVPGNTRTLIAESPSPPTRVISARLLERNPSATYTEQVEIRRVVYADNPLTNRSRNDN